MSGKIQVPLVEGLFTWPSKDMRLIASRCVECGTLAFPKLPYCTNPDCIKDRAKVQIIELSNKARLYTWTVQVYLPSLPFRMEPARPFPIGMLDLPEGIRVLGMLTTDDVSIGMEMELGAMTLFEDETREYLTWAWRPGATNSNIG